MANRWATMVAGVMVMVGSAGVAADQDRPIGSRILIPSGPSVVMVHKAVRGAAARLATPDCQAVLTDFRDVVGETLKDNLAKMARNPSQFVGDVWFIDATDGQGCKTNLGVAAYTNPGSRIINVCSSRFSDPNFGLGGINGVVVIIHEILHALGLGENGPHPSAREISNRVLARCGRD